jgi:predicted N-acyltransferase
MHSAHYIAHEGLRSAVESFLIHERNAMIAHVADLKMQSAYRLKECT